MRAYGYETKAVLPENQGIASWYNESEIDIEYIRSQPLRRRRPLFGQFIFLLYLIVDTIHLWKLIKDENIDIIHVNEVIYLQGLLAGKLSGAQTVCHVRAAFESRWIRKILSGITLFCSDRVVCVSERTYEVMFSEVGYDSDKVDVLHDGLPSPERFENYVDPMLFRESIGIQSDDFLVVCISKLVHTKGQDRLLEVVSSISDVEFAIVGGEVDGHKQYARQLAKRASSIPNVQLTGFYPDITEVLHSADIVVHVPRNDDPFPGVVLEAMISGNPVIGSNTGGIPEQIIDGETGYLISKRGGEEDLKKYIRMLYNNPDLCQSMGEKAKEIAYETHDPEAYFKSISQLYSGL